MTCFQFVKVSVDSLLFCHCTRKSFLSKNTIHCFQLSLFNDKQVTLKLLPILVLIVLPSILLLVTAAGLNPLASAYVFIIIITIIIPYSNPLCLFSLLPTKSKKSSRVSLIPLVFSLMVSTSAAKSTFA